MPQRHKNKLERAEVAKWSKATDSRSVSAVIQGFNSLSPHSCFFWQAFLLIAQFLSREKYRKLKDRRDKGNAGHMLGAG